MSAALAGISVLLMVSADEDPQRSSDQLTFLRAAEAAAVRHVVYTSIKGASSNPAHGLAHDDWLTEEFLRQSTMSFTILRNGLYMDFMRGLVGEDGVIRGPAGDGKAALVARSDIARVAVTVLLHPTEHEGAAYVLTDRRRSVWPRSLGSCPLQTTV